MSNYLFFLLILACPLAMVFMMRGMHGGHGGDGGRGEKESGVSLDELHRQRDQLDREIEKRKSEEETPTPVGGGWR